MKERLDKILASQNIGSRKDVGLLIRKGAITVNGLVVKKSDTKVDGDLDEICVNGISLQFKRHLYLMMNKPAGILSAARTAVCRQYWTYCLKYIAAVDYFLQEDWTVIRRGF